jgi:hypothetical protein
MIKRQLCELEFNISDVDQILNMGGPWICSLYYENALVSGNCILDNFLEDNSCQKIYFVKYHRISKWWADNFCTLNYFSINDSEVFQSKARFEMLYIKGFLDPKNIEIFHAFHENVESRRAIFDIADQQFINTPINL